MKRIHEILKKYRHAWVFLYTFIYLPWYMYLERTITHEYHVLHTWVDDIIPFNEYFIIPYFIWFIYVASVLIFFFFKDVDEFYRFGLYLALGMSISLFICQIFPNGTDLRPVNLDPNKNIFTHLVAFIYKTDTNTNVFPSIHVFNHNNDFNMPFDIVPKAAFIPGCCRSNNTLICYISAYLR